MSPPPEKPVRVEPRAEPPADVIAPTPRIDQWMDAYVSGLPIGGGLIAAVRYALLGPGKRMRPLLAWHCCAAAGADPEASLPAATAVEMVHAFSLVHDDLPAMDDDDLRRGRPTLHVHAGEAMAILAGDALLGLAFQVIAERSRSAALATDLTRELARANNAMIAGQVFDTLGSPDLRPLSDLERLELIHRHKTGALIRAACRMGVMAALDLNPGARWDALDQLTEYAEAVGLMFQVVDDILDVTQSEERIGKRANKDAAAGKLTYPTVVGLDRSRSLVEHLRERGMAALASLGPAAEPLRRLCSYLAVRDH
ncbi:MAG: polyprenyl synthetase family protein [Phycisphaerae bacterium]|nr:polyprenyl synthetase family protein [Phycisphaerae bacterium]